MVELVLPSGRFAQIRDATAGDIVYAYHSNPLLMTMILASRMVTLDGEEVPLADWLKMPLTDYSPIMNAVSSLTINATQQKKGIA